MRYTQFRITNYKGIREPLELDLDIQPDNKIYTLIGLNESGKTTILEAINDFEFEVPESERHLLIPKSEAGGFSGEISIKANLRLTPDDQERIRAHILKATPAKEIEIGEEIILERRYDFENSLPNGTSYTYEPFVHIRKTQKSPLVDLSDDIDEGLWTFIRGNLLPEIMYYRDFLVKLPHKIYLEPKSALERRYVAIIEDVLTSINASYNVQNSLLTRLSDPTPANSQALEAVENELAAKISNVVFEAWNKIQQVSKKEIVAKTDRDEEGRFYIRLSVKEGNQTYAISERSLGFRWFFTFLLYTEFRKERIKTSGEILFLLDEPASNLHQTAQKSLLDTFRTITSKSRLIYTTHSHHLINPDWLNSAYIIKNKALKYNQEDNNFISSRSEIEAYKYKQFVAHYPKETSYFQPILDVLDYQPGLLELVPRIVITEGKFDYFTFKYFKEIVLQDNREFSFYPGQGATVLGLPIALYESWGRLYLVLLDADKEGRTQKARYIKDLSDDQHIFTLEDVDSSNKNFTTESLFSDDEKIKISQVFNPSLISYEKSAFNTGIQTLLAERRVPDFIADETKAKMQRIVSFLDSKFSS